MLEVKDLYVRRGGFNILKGVSFQLPLVNLLPLLGQTGLARQLCFERFREKDQHREKC